MPAVYNMRRGVEPRPPPDCEYIGRPGPYGNPFKVGVDGAHGECVRKYREWLYAPEQADFRALVQRELRGRNLMCWCKPNVCHGDVLLELANT